MPDRRAPMRTALLMASLFVLAALSGATAHAESSPESGESADYRRTVEEALEEYQLRHFEEARGLFQHAHELEPSARTLRGLGMVEFELRHYAAAAELLQQSLHDPRKALTDEQRAAVEQLLAKTGHFTAHYRLEISPPDADPMLELDGAELPPPADQQLTLTAGEHLLRVSAAGHAPAELKLDARGGEQRTLSIELRALDPAAVASAAQRDEAGRVARTGHPHRKLGIVLGATGGAVLAAGLAVGAMALFDKAGEARSGAPDYQDKADQARRMSHIADALIAVGAATAVTGTVLLLWRRREQPSAAHAGLRLESVAPTLRVRF
jgi:tetratricopeptide (TPR) repeat protein